MHDEDVRRQRRAISSAAAASFTAACRFALSLTPFEMTAPHCRRRRADR
jgi:hypothetical protein